MRSSVLLVVILALITFPLMAQSNDVAIWGGISRVGSTDVSGSNIHFDRGHAYGASFNHFFGEHLSGELAVFEVRHNGSIQIGGVNTFDVGSLKMMPVTATLQWHFARAARFDVYAGGGAAYVRSNSLHSSDLDTVGVGRVDIKSKIGWTGLGGVSYSLMHPLAVAAEARYISYRPDSGPSDARVRLDLSPVLYSVGLRWRF
jgi:outer membrane protein W